MPEINLDHPGTLSASADNAKDYTFYIVVDKPQYTQQSFEQNYPNCASPADLIFKSDVLPDHMTPDGGGATVDLTPKAEEIRSKLKDPETRAKVAVVATSLPGNQDPQKRMALVTNYTIKGPILHLTGFGYNPGVMGPAQAMQMAQAAQAQAMQAAQAAQTQAMAALGLPPPPQQVAAPPPQAAQKAQQGFRPNFRRFRDA